MLEAFALTNPPARAKSLKHKPGWWLARLEILTREHRNRRADCIMFKGSIRREEALDLREELRDSAAYESMGVPRLAPMRAIPGATKKNQKILRHWDTDVKNTSRGRRRLLRGDHESADSMLQRIYAVAAPRMEGKWHADRAKGQVERFKLVDECGKEERGILSCVHCKNVCRDGNGNAIIVQKRCAATLLCHTCRQIKIGRERKRFEKSRVARLEQIKQRRWGAWQGKRNPLIERFLTLTCPHIALDQGITLQEVDGTVRVLRGPEAQAYLVRKAWSKFMNSLRNGWRDHPAFDLSAYVRVLEATSGQDDLGHVHIHLWFIAPFTRVHVIKAKWGRALIAAGFPLELWPEHAWKDKAEIIAELRVANRGGPDEPALKWAKYLKKRVAWPQVDIKPVDSSLALELIKYLTKDLESGPDGMVLMAPELFAAVYRGLDTGRLITASRKFWVKKHCECQACGAIDSLRPHAEPRESPGLARGPPLQALLFDISSNTCA